jgi:transcriptional regulator with XRE-family HTH domain
MFFSSNIKFLRKRRRRTQDDVASALGMKRPTLSGYENNVAQPNLGAMVAFSDYFGIAIDTLVKVDLTSLPESQISQLERGYDVFITGSKLRVLATTVTPENTDNIELVNEKASAGYSRSFADPEFIRILPVFQLPFLPRDRKYRTFQISGDSVEPTIASLSRNLLSHDCSGPSGTGEAKDALAQMGIALRDQSGSLRRSEDLLAEVADSFARIEDPAERVRLAFKLFDSEGVALVNLLRGGSGALEHHLANVGESSSVPSNSV